jgi:16S rRNA (guanine1516-N2)-methyltransferase
VAAQQDLSGDPYVVAVDGHLELRFHEEPATASSGLWVPLDEVRRRAAEGGLLLRACGVRGGNRPRVLDPMAGLGVDGLLLAARGCEVTLVERHPMLCELMEDLTRRSGLSGVTCVCGDGFLHLADEVPYEVIYLDPMFPARNKHSLPHKRMQWLSRLAEPDHRPLGEWIDAAVAAAENRVVLKRRRKDPQVRRPDWQIPGRTVRFDVYRGNA